MHMDGGWHGGWRALVSPVAGLCGLSIYACVSRFLSVCLSLYRDRSRLIVIPIQTFPVRVSVAAAVAVQLVPEMLTWKRSP